MLPPPEDTLASYVYVPVPRDRVEAVFRFLLEGETAPPKAVPGEGLVQRVFVESEEQFRALLFLLARHPGEPQPTDEIAEELRLPNGAASLAGMLGAFARRAKNRYEGFWPFDRLYNPATEKSELVMDPRIAEMVKQLS